MKIRLLFRSPRLGRGLACAFAALFLVFSPPLLAQSGGSVTFDDVARFVAGKRPSSGSSLNRLWDRPAVRRHVTDSQALEEEWRQRRLEQVSEWARKEIHPHIARPSIVKYPFGGPDFVHAATIFPGANEYVLVGLEPLGTLPDLLGMNDAELDAFLGHLSYTLRSISRRNFFITKEMREDFGKRGLDGVYPVLLYFAALTEHEVLDGKFVKLADSGEVVETGAGEAATGEANGIRLELRATDRLPDFPATQTLYYFKSDLSNAGFKPGSPLKGFFEQRPGGVGYLKAASFLMHTEDFSNIRNFLVGDCEYILQDASGIPAKFFDLYYDVTYYGNYVGPIDMFSEYDQPELRRIYRSGVARPLPFGTGYRYRDEDSVQMFGVKK